MPPEQQLEPPAQLPGFLAALLTLALMGLYFAGIPSKLSNPLYFGSFLLLVISRFTRKEAVSIGLPIALLTMTGALLGTDVAIRVFFSDKVHFRPLEVLQGRHPLYPELLRFFPSTRVEMDTYGDIAAASSDEALRELRRVVFQTDELGWRNPPGKAGQSLDLIALGDSFTLGAGSTQEKTWVRILEESRGAQVYNLAYPADPTGEVLLLKATLPLLKTKPGTTVIWSLFEGNDFRPTGHPSLNLPTPATVFRQWKSSLSVFRNRSPIRNLLRRVSSSKSSIYAKRFQVGKEANGGPVLFYQEYLDEVQKQPPIDDAGLLAVRAAVAEMARFTQEKGLGLLVVGLPTKARVYPDLLPEGSLKVPRTSQYLEFLREVCVTEGLPYFDATDQLQKAAALRPFLWWRDDTHWNEAGNALFARLVSERL